MDAYLDGELDPVTSQKVEQHLRDCRKCEQAYEVETAMARRADQPRRYRRRFVTGQTSPGSAAGRFL